MHSLVWSLALSGSVCMFCLSSLQIMVLPTVLGTSLAFFNLFHPPCTLHLHEFHESHLWQKRPLQPSLLHASKLCTLPLLLSCCPSMSSWLFEYVSVPHPLSSVITRKQVETCCLTLKSIL